MFKRYLLVSCLFLSLEAFSETTDDPAEDVFGLNAYESINENSHNPYSVLENPEFSFENFDMNILERKKKTNIESEEIQDSKCDEEKDSNTLFTQVDPISTFPNDGSDDFFMYEENFIAIASNPPIYREFPDKDEHKDCPEAPFFDVIHNNPSLNEFNDLHYININYYN